MKATHMERNTEVGRVVVALLALRNRTRTELAEHFNLDVSVISKGITGRRNWSIHDIENFAEFFDVPVTVFFNSPEQLAKGLTDIRPTTGWYGPFIDDTDMSPGAWN